MSSYQYVEFVCLLHFIHSFHGSSFSDCIIVNEANIARIIYHNAKLLLTFISVGGRFVNWMWHRIQQIVCQPTYKHNSTFNWNQRRCELRVFNMYSRTRKVRILREIFKEVRLGHKARVATLSLFSYESICLVNLCFKRDIINSSLYFPFRAS